MRISPGATVGLVLLLAQLATSNTSYAKDHPIYAIDPTPTPATMPVGATDPLAGLQRVSDQIGAVSVQITLTAQDSSLSVDAKVQQINSLAGQFNQLVAQWQQQVTQIQNSSTAPPVPSVGGVRATPIGTPPQNGPGLTATPVPTRSTTTPTAVPTGG